jgi:curved DNA-binding protein CbpA
MPPTINHYDVLQVPKIATDSEIRDSYKRLALLHHPDKNAGDPEATIRFQEVGSF